MSRFVPSHQKVSWSEAFKLARRSELAYALSLATTFLEMKVKKLGVVREHTNLACGAEICKFGYPRGRESEKPLFLEPRSAVPGWRILCARSKCTATLLANHSWLVNNYQSTLRQFPARSTCVYTRNSHGRYSVNFNFKAPWCKSSAGQQANLLACPVFGHNANFPQRMHLLVYNQQISLWNFEANVNIIFNFDCFLLNYLVPCTLIIPRNWKVCL
jgi:hypothetical protein